MRHQVFHSAEHGTIEWLVRLGFLTFLAVVSFSGRLLGDDAEWRRELQYLREHNERLQQQLQTQQESIDGLRRTVSDLQRPPAASSADDARATSGARGEASARSAMASTLGKLHISGEGGLAFFEHQREGKFPHGAFRVDEAKLFVEAPVWQDVYFFTELNLFRREDPNDVMNVGELYLDFENLSRWWQRDGQLNFRVGRFDIPFGEEYLTRDAIDNALISHSVADFWGVDEGVEFYGGVGRLNYVLAAQNGGHPSLNDYNADKSVTVRLGYDPVKWLHLGVSAMRTGNLDVQGDVLSELWFGNGFVRSLGSSNTTHFKADLMQGDLRLRWRDGHLALAGGYLRYSDNDSIANNRRDVYFYSVEAVHHVATKFHAAARFSEILARKGFPVVGDGEFSEYFFEELTDDLWRLSLGAGYHFSPNLLLKAEYSWNEGREPSGDKRIHENLFAAEVSFKF